MFEFLGGIFDGVGGATEGGGLFGGLFDMLFGGGEMLGGFARAGASEGFLSEILGSAARLFGQGADMYIDYLCWRDLCGQGNNRSYQDFESAWRGMSGASQATLKQVSEVVKGHGFILQQLRAHKDKKGIAEILAKYEALGTQLPHEDLLKTAYHELAKILHTDNKGVVGDELIKLLNNGRDALENAAKCSAYRDMLQNNPAGIEKLYAEMGKVDWKKGYEAAARETRLRLSGPAAKGSKANKWLNELSPNKLALLMFAVCTTVAVGTYAAVTIAENHKRKRVRKAQVHPASYRERMNEETMHKAVPTATVSGLG